MKKDANHRLPCFKSKGNPCPSKEKTVLLHSVTTSVQNF